MTGDVDSRFDGAGRAGAPARRVGPAHGASGRRGSTRAEAVRRMLDVLVALLVIVLAAPLMCLIALLIRATSDGPVLFRQSRVGHLQRAFTMLKFRTMTTGADDRSHRDFVTRMMCGEDPRSCGSTGLFKIHMDPRITPVGRWLRRTSLDELPQLFNVLRGEMSLVGPRPVLTWEVALYEPRHLTRFLVRPGLTGLWQVCGRNRLTMSEALELDVEYVARSSLALDLKILARTLPALLRGDGG
jgi:lipopolysaccharide/colanic/teichoic acid biosynthesis glycosyltransferase